MIDLSKPEETADRLSLADRWWDLAANESEQLRTAMQRRAVYWYRQALPDLKGLARDKANKRIASAVRLDDSNPATDGARPKTDDIPPRKPQSPIVAAINIQHEAEQCRTAREALLRASNKMI